MELLSPIRGLIGALRRPGGLAASILVLALAPGPGRAQGGGAAGPVPSVTIPLVIDPDRRIERRELPRNTALRFVTEEDFPPFNYIGRDGQLAGFNIDLARAICAELAVSCAVQPRRWDLLLPALDRDEADAVIAGHRITAELRARYEVSLPTHRSPARFATRRDGAITDIAAIRGRTVAVVGGSAHEAFLNALFPAVTLKRFERIDQALEAMRRGEADLAFGDGIAIAFWMNGSESLDCCAFLGGPFTESRFFGEGAGIVVKGGNIALRAAIDHALWRISRDGRYAKLYLKHFPIPYY
ncbi:MAG: transporter substrate-binding domain-containing protein [Hyphomicrobiales bacterium]|nr:transporter substrate-binding domain-containing protein [Hyphomicrobiales bacterium]